MRVAVLDDDAGQLELICLSLAAQNHDCHRFTDNKVLLKALRRETFDLLVIDSKAPDDAAIEMMRWARQNLLDRVPLLYISDRQSEDAIVEALGAGADALMGKPVRLGELTARVEALLRRTYRHAGSDDLAIGRHRFDSLTSTASLDGRPVALKQKEFGLALFLFQNIGRLLSRQHLLEAVWGVGVEISSRTLDTHLCRLRNKLELMPENGYRLSSVYGVGYRLEAVLPGENVSDAEHVEDPAVAQS
jgi:DNA-binding response OmpR family regulator